MLMHRYALELEAFGDVHMWDPSVEKMRAFENSRAFQVLQVRRVCQALLWWVALQS
jgi:hypothetical protein